MIGPGLTWEKRSHAVQLGGFKVVHGHSALTLLRGNQLGTPKQGSERKHSGADDDTFAPAVLVEKRSQVSIDGNESVLAARGVQPMETDESYNSVGANRSLRQELLIAVR